MKAEKIEDYKSILAECYRQDPALITLWHTVAGQGLEACVEKEFSDLKALKAKFFIVREAGELVGYFCKERLQNGEALTGFFLVPALRTKAKRAQFWNVIRSHFKNQFFCGLYDKNAPARRFIESKGGVAVRKSNLPDGPAVLYRVV